MRHKCEIKIRKEAENGRYVWFACFCYFLADTPEQAMYQAIHSTMEFPGFRLPS